MKIPSSRSRSIFARLVVGASLCFAGAVDGVAGGEWSLVDAVREGDRDAVRSLIRTHSAVNDSQPDGTTALAWAVHRDDAEIVELLIRAGADVNAGNVYGVTPLSLACGNRNAAMVEILLKSGANPNAAQETGETPLMTCVRTGESAAVRSLLARGANVNVKDTERGQTPLMWAAAQGHPAIVRMLLERGAALDARSARLGLYTPRVPEPTLFSPTGVPVHQAYRASTYFPKFKGGFTPLMFAAQAGDAESAAILLAAGAKVNDGTPEEGTPLVLASSNGREQAALLLLEKGADPNGADCYGMTALHWALQEGVLVLSGGHTVTDPFWVHPRMPGLVKALLARGANANARIARDFMTYHVHRFARGTQMEPPQVSQAGATPFLLAAAAADTEAMQMLLEAGADPKTATFEGTTPLMVGAGTGIQLETRGAKESVSEERGLKALQVVKLALKTGGDVNAIGPGNRTALHGAALYGLTEVIRFLAEQGADLNAKDMWGQSAVSIAMADPDGLVYRNLPDKGQDSTFRRKAGPDKGTVDLLLKLGATPYIPNGRDLREF